MSTMEWSLITNGTECTAAGSESSPVREARTGHPTSPATHYFPTMAVQVSGPAYGSMVGKSLLIVGTPHGLSLEVNQSVLYDPGG